MGLRELFQNHLQVLQTETAKTLAELKLDGLVLSAGEPAWYFEDDQNPPFRSNHHFKHWCPMEGSHHILIFIPGQKPQVRLYQPLDFWHEARPFEPDFWGDSFQVELISDQEKLWDHIAQGRRLGYHGPEMDRARTAGLLVDVPGLLSRLNWQRLVKSPYEIQSLIEATRKGAAGHKAAERAFRQGGSELDIHFAFMQAARSQEQDLPYENIVALNEKAAYLHYGAKRDEVHNGKVLLIDAGACVRGYGSDITRTYATEDAPEEFRALLDDMGQLQAGLVAAITPNFLMGDLHVLAHQRIAELLLRHKIILDCDVQEAVDAGFTSAFFPHGLGHMLGLFVHDVAGKQVDRAGATAADPRFPKLRTTRPLQPGTVVTIEPGVYFIKMLLDPIRQGSKSRNLNWALIDRLIPCGGIRIEDNVHIHENGVRNLTREYLP